MQAVVHSDILMHLNKRSLPSKSGRYIAIYPAFSPA